MTAVLFAAKAAGLTTSDLYTVDPGTAAPTSLGPTGYAITGLAPDPTDPTQLYGVTSPGSGASPRSLIRIDLSAYPAITVTLVGSLGGKTIPDIAFDSTGQIYGWNNTDGVLAKIDKTTGAISNLGASGIGGGKVGNGIAITSADVCYLFPKGSTANYYTMNLTTGAATLVGSLDGSGLGTSITAATFDVSNVCWAINGDGATVSQLDTINVATGVKTLIGALTPDGGMWDALAWGDSPTPPPPGPSRRFFAGYPWRFIVTDLNSETITFLDRLATARQVTVARNTARDASGTVPSDSPEVNLTHTDGDPFMAEGNRLVYGFRREGWNGLIGPWVCQFGGPLDHLEDNAGTDAPASHWTAHDPWRLLYKRPVRLADGTLPGVDGRVFLAADSWTYQQIAKRLLTDSILYDGTCHIDPDGGTVVDGTPIVGDLTLQQGLSVGAAWDQLCQTGKIDIELDPLYDPVGSSGICCTFNAKPIIGTVQNAAIFAWDLPSRSLADIGRVLDGTGRANTIQYYYGQGGPPVALETDAASVAKYGEYWEQQFWPGFREAGPVSAMAARRLALVKDGAKTFTFAPAPERSPIPFDDYMAGDWAPFYASKKLRAPLNPVLMSGVWQNIPRIEAFTIDIADNQTETVSQLLTSLEVQPT